MHTTCVVWRASMLLRRKLPVQELFIRAAAVSCLQWHPFTVIAGDQPNTYVAYVKACGGWTRRLISR